MSRSGLLFALFCMGVAALYFMSARNGYSPFADGGNRGGAFFYGGRSGGGGPHHK
ncbi:hypothetical protein [Sphingomonas sp.]|uniref:hypothetical protein n=1 Tax=Sphingomonas sp. TaxID=28214 RepID=UPI003CC6D80E